MLQFLFCFFVVFLLVLVVRRFLRTTGLSRGQCSAKLNGCSLAVNFVCPGNVGHSTVSLAWLGTVLGQGPWSGKPPNTKASAQQTIIQSETPPTTSVCLFFMPRYFGFYFLFDVFCWFSIFCFWFCGLRALAGRSGQPRSRCSPLQLSLYAPPECHSEPQHGVPCLVGHRARPGPVARKTTKHNITNTSTQVNNTKSKNHFMFGFFCHELICFWSTLFLVLLRWVFSQPLAWECSAKVKRQSLAVVLACPARVGNSEPQHFRQYQLQVTAH